MRIGLRFKKKKRRGLRFFKKKKKRIKKLWKIEETRFRVQGKEEKEKTTKENRIKI
jgi:hypothetical protein